MKKEANSPLGYAVRSARVRGLVVSVAGLAVDQLGPAAPAHDDGRAGVGEPVHLAVLARHLGELLRDRVAHLPRVLDRRAVRVLPELGRLLRPPTSDRVSA